MINTEVQTLPNGHAHHIEPRTFTFALVNIQEPRGYGKTLTLDKGRLRKTVQGGHRRGTVRRVTTDLEGLSDILVNGQPGQHLMSGVPDIEVDVDAPLACEEARRPGDLTRTKECMSLPREPGLMTVDADQQIPAQMLIEQLCEACPDLVDVPIVATVSSGSNIMDASSGEVLTPEKGWHVLIPVLDASDMPRALEVLFDRVWLAGYGRVEIGKTGRPLLRCCVDKALANPVQPVFIRSHLGPGLLQNKQVLYFHEGGDTPHLDTRTALPSLTAAEKARLEQLQRQAIADVSVALADAQAAYIAQRTKTLVAKGVSEDRARSTVKLALGTQDLGSDWPVVLSDGSTVTVRQILDNPQAYHGKACRDPLEPDYGSPTVAMIFCDPQIQGKPLIKSHAHGGRHFFLKSDVIAPEDIDRLLAKARGDRQMEGGWPELDPLPEIESLEQPPEAFPFDALGPIAGPAAAAIAAQVQLPGAIAAGSVLAAVALAAQALADVVLPHGARSPLSLAIFTAAASGDRKSRADSIACEPIEDFKREQYRRYSREVQAAKEFAGPKSERPEPPKAVSLTVSKGTVEGLTKQLLQQSHIGLFSPDGADVLGGHSMQAERRAAGIAWYLRAWSGETLDNLTAGNGLMVVSGRRLTMHLLIQPIVLQNLMADPLAQGQGLIARALIACPDTIAGSRLFRMPGPGDERTIAVLHERIKTMLAMPLPVHPDGDGFELKPRGIRLDAEATALWIAFHDEVEARQAPGADLAAVRPWASKAAEQAARIAGNLAVLEGCGEVQAHHMVSGMRVASFYLTEHVRLMGVSTDLEHARRLHALLDFLRKRGPRVTREEALQHTPRIVRNLKADGITPLWDELVGRGYIRKSGSTWEVRPWV